MNIDERVFAYKLYEMEEQYGKLQCRIRTCERGGKDKIHSELERAREEYAENSMLLEEKARSCRSPAVRKRRSDRSRSTKRTMKSFLRIKTEIRSTRPEWWRIRG